MPNAEFSLLTERTSLRNRALTLGCWRGSIEVCEPNLSAGSLPNLPSVKGYMCLTCLCCAVFGTTFVRDWELAIYVSGAFFPHRAKLPQSKTIGALIVTLGPIGSFHFDRLRWAHLAALFLFGNACLPSLSFLSHLFIFPFLFASHVH